MQAIQVVPEQAPSRIRPRSIGGCFLTGSCATDLVYKTSRRFLGEPLEHDCKEEFFVAALLFKPPFKQLRCALRLPFFAWVQAQTGIIKPTRTFKFIGDSTFAEFRNDICQHVRSAHQYDMHHWLSQGGAWETDLAEDLAIAPKTDNTVMSPNGNRLMRQDRMVEPTWLQPNAEHICGGLRENSTFGIGFVGDADLSPGVDHGQVYARLSKAYMSIFA